VDLDRGACGIVWHIAGTQAWDLRGPLDPLHRFDLIAELKERAVVDFVSVFEVPPGTPIMAVSRIQRLLDEDPF